MIIPEEFDRIRPFEPEELPAVYERLIADEQFRKVMSIIYPDVPFEALAQKLRGCKTSLEFQKTFPYHFLEKLLANVSTGCGIDCTEIDNNSNYTFV